MLNLTRHTHQTTKNGTSTNSNEVIDQASLLTKTLDNLEEFRLAVSQAQIEGIKHLTVSDKLFAYLTKNSNDLYITYGDPGLKLYREGLKDKAEKRDSRTAEQAMREE